MGGAGTSWGCSITSRIKVDVVPLEDMAAAAHRELSSAARSAAMMPGQHRVGWGTAGEREYSGEPLGERISGLLWPLPGNPG
jgi:hypothetical protein